MLKNNKITKNNKKITKNNKKITKKGLVFRTKKNKQINKHIFNLFKLQWKFSKGFAPKYYTRRYWGGERCTQEECTVLVNDFLLNNSVLRSIFYLFRRNSYKNKIKIQDCILKKTFPKILTIKAVISKVLKNQEKITNLSLDFQVFFDYLFGAILIGLLNSLPNSKIFKNTRVLWWGNSNMSTDRLFLFFLSLKRGRSFKNERKWNIKKKEGYVQLPSLYDNWLNHKRDATCLLKFFQKELYLESNVSSMLLDVVMLKTKSINNSIPMVTPLVSNNRLFTKIFWVDIRKKYHGQKRSVCSIIIEYILILVEYKKMRSDFRTYFKNESTANMEKELYFFIDFEFNVHLFFNTFLHGFDLVKFLLARYNKPIASNKQILRHMVVFENSLKKEGIQFQNLNFKYIKKKNWLKYGPSMDVMYNIKKRLLALTLCKRNFCKKKLLQEVFWLKSSFFFKSADNRNNKYFKNILKKFKRWLLKLLFKKKKSLSIKHKDLHNLSKIIKNLDKRNSLYVPDIPAITEKGTYFRRVWLALIRKKQLKKDKYLN